jgi:hypothetical protein
MTIGLGLTHAAPDVMGAATVLSLARDCGSLHGTLSTEPVGSCGAKWTTVGRKDYGTLVLGPEMRRRRAVQIIACRMIIMPGR